MGCLALTYSLLAMLEEIANDLGTVFTYYNFEGVEDPTKTHILCPVSYTHLEELKALIYASDIFCFPSITKNEAFGLALAEAMYYEKPAITFTIPGSGVNYVNLNDETGIEVDNRNVKKYAEAIEKLAEDKNLRKKYGEAGRMRVMNNFLSTQYLSLIHI